MNIINAKDLKNWARFACEMQRLKKIFPEYEADLKNCVLLVAEKIKPSADMENERAIEEIQRQAEGLRVCHVCGFPLDRRQEKFCSIICKSIAARKTYLKAKYPHLTVNGEKAYVHRVAWQKNHGRRLLPGEVVHHINCDPTDNRPENLQAMTISEHSALHHRLARQQRRALNGCLFEGFEM